MNLIRNLILNKSNRSVLPTVLFVSHDANPHGAQILLLNVLRWIKNNTAIPFVVLLKRTGPLQSEFQSLTTTWVWDDGSDTLLKTLNKHKIGLVYVNTITNGELMAWLSQLKVPQICHVHELGFWIRYRTDKRNNELVQQHTKHYVVVSQAVRLAVTDVFNIAPEQITLIYEGVSTPTVNRQQARLNTLAEINAPNNALIVGASGTMDWRKGADLFVQLAIQVLKKFASQPVHFVWVGTPITPQDSQQIAYDVTQAGLSHLIHFVGKKTNPFDYFASFDTFALLSREDPFPLVMLEAAHLSIPIVGFDNSGGAPEFIDSTCGAIVPYLDLSAMAEIIVAWLQDSQKRMLLGAAGSQKVHLAHTIPHVGKQVVTLIESLLKP